MTDKKSARQRQILAALDQTPTLRVKELADHLGVSTETVRRDLDELTERGLIDRTYGGATVRRSLEPSVGERHQLFVPEREAIARKARPMLAGAAHILIGSGATTVHVARRIAVEMNNVTVITHAFGVATVLSLNPTISVLMAPGLYHAGEGAMHGAATMRFLETVRADWAVLGASGLDETGPSDALIEMGEVYAAMAARAERALLVADHSKFDQTFPSCWAKWPDLAHLICDEAPPPRLAAAIQRAGVQTHLA